MKPKYIWFTGRNNFTLYAGLPLLLLSVLPFATSNTYFIYLMSLTFLFSAVAVNLDIMLGRLGMFTFGHAAVFGAGGYTSALLAKYFGFPVPLSIVAGGLAACLICLPIGLVGLRLHGAYFAIATLAMSEILRLIYLRILDQWTYGESGLWGIDPLPDLALGNVVIKFSTSITAQYFLFLGLMLLNILFFYKLLQTRMGLFFTAIREDELAAKSLSIDTIKYKLIGFLLSSFFTGLAGAVYAHWLGTFSPALMSIPQTVFFIAIVLIGGVRTTIGPIIGSFISVIILEFLKYSGYHFIIFSILIIVITFLFPGGVVGSFKELFFQKYSQVKSQDKQ
ncbi:MAG: branched-chain amino acid ABC transporter permease [Candidatus Caldarchaeum sp.]|nr:branched-chain amino acid ABC transporter permease [Candidatus Caldarchaeum sp.]